MRADLDRVEKTDVAVREGLLALAIESFPEVPPGSLTLSADLVRECGVDSLSLIAFYIAVEERFAIKLRGMRPELARTLQDWANWVSLNKDVRAQEAVTKHNAPVSMSTEELAKAMQGGRIGKRLARRVLQSVAKTLSTFSPRSATRLLTTLYLTPGKMAVAPWEIDIRKKAVVNECELNGVRFSYYSWGTGPCILLCHGWGGHATQLGQLVPPLLDAGFRVIALDAPGHGKSKLKQSHWSLYAGAVRHLANRYTITVGIGHCFGAAMLASVLGKTSLPLEKLVLISPFDNFSWLADLYSKTLMVPRELVDGVFTSSDEKHFTQTSVFTLSCLQQIAQQGIPTLVVHDMDDEFVPYRHAQYIASADCVQLASTEGLGHKFILIHPPTIRQIVNFVTD